MESQIIEFFHQYAYYPYWIYTGICFFMILSAFGLPLPEEVVLISAGFVGFAALNPLTPLPPGTHVVNVYVLATVSFVAVIGSDYLIYFLGQKFGPRILRWKIFARLIRPDAMERIQIWVRKYGYFAVILFRFTPGVRFPGHLMCGAMGLSPWKFLAVDAMAAGFSVPTQVLLVSFYGEHIVKYLSRFKFVVFSVLGLVILAFLLRKFLAWRRAKALLAAPPTSGSSSV